MGRHSSIRIRFSAITLAITLIPQLSCTESGKKLPDLASFEVRVSSINGSETLPTKEDPLPVNLGDRDEKWDFTIRALKPNGDLNDSFNGYVRLTSEPGDISEVTGTGSMGRNIKLLNGVASGQAIATAVFGETRLWAEDLGYAPAEDLTQAACSNGTNDDPEEDVLIDYPADPGCAYADDDSELEGSFTVGVSQILQYAYPTLSELQGFNSSTAYPYESIIQVNTEIPQNLVVTRVASDGFYVTDISQSNENYNHIFAFNFSTPDFMQVCDHVSYLTGTISEFYGFTELSFPSYEVDHVNISTDCTTDNRSVAGCLVPDPSVIDGSYINPYEDLDPNLMEPIESGLVRLEDIQIPSYFGENLANCEPADSTAVCIFSSDASSCDFTGNGTIDYEESEVESACSTQCEEDPECTEWTGYASRGNYKVHKSVEYIDSYGSLRAGQMLIQIKTDTIPTFDPTLYRGQEMSALTGTLRNFSGGSLNWTVETRCSDDLVCSFSSVCQSNIKSSKESCVCPTTDSGTDEGTQ